MSKFCDKCDFYDWIADKDDEYIQNSRFYIYHKGRECRLDIHNQFDAALYYPFIVALAGANQDGANIVLSSDCYIDTRENEHRKWQIHDVLKEWRKCKRKKIPFIHDEVFKRVAWGNKPDPQLDAIIDAVSKDGKKASFEHIHYPLQEYYRRIWYQHLVEIGYDTNTAYRWVFKDDWFMHNAEERLKAEI